MSTISKLDSKTNIEDSFIFLAVSNSKNLKVPSYKLINFLNKNLEISKTRPFLSPSEFFEDKFLLTSKTNRLYVTTISPSEISYDAVKKSSFEQEYNNLNKKLNEDYVNYRNTILSHIDLKERVESDVEKTLMPKTFEDSALIDTYKATVSTESDSSDTVAVFEKNDNSKFILTNLALNKKNHKGYYVAKNLSSVLGDIEKIENICLEITGASIEIQKIGTQKFYNNGKGKLCFWNFGTEDARELPTEHIKHILDTVRTKVTGLSYTSADIDTWLQYEGDDLPAGVKAIKLEEVISDIRHKIATTNSVFIASKYQFYKIYDLYSAGQELYDVMDTILECTINPNRPKWEGEYTQYLNYKTCGSSNLWGKVVLPANLLVPSENYVNHSKVFG